MKKLFKRLKSEPAVTDEAAQSKAKKTARPNKKMLFWALIAVLVLLVGYFGFQYAKTRNELTRAQNPELAAKTEAEDLAKELGAYLELPKDEAPTIATVNDAEGLKSQIFFEHAQNGDKVLIFPNARKAVLYRPSTKKVIEYAPVSLGATN